MAITAGQKKAIYWWAGISAVLWVTWFVLRLTIGGNCERPELVKNFEAKKYLGRWYEIYRKDNPFENEDCATATYIELPYSRIEVNNVEFSIKEQKNIRGISDPGTAQCSTLQSGHCQVKFFELTPWSDYNIIYTDYTTHTIVHGCDNFVAGMVKVDWLWSLTRTPLAVGSSDHTAITTTIFNTLKEKLPSFDTSLFYKTK